MSATAVLQKSQPENNYDHFDAIWVVIVCTIWECRNQAITIIENETTHWKRQWQLSLPAETFEPEKDTNLEDTVIRGLAEEIKIATENIVIHPLGYISMDFVIWDIRKKALWKVFHVMLPEWTEIKDISCAEISQVSLTNVQALSDTPDDTLRPGSREALEMFLWWHPEWAHITVENGVKIQ